MSAELCAFLEAEAGAQLHAENLKISKTNDELTSELAASEAHAAKQAAELAAQACVAAPAHATHTHP